ncbi:MAG: hypothetical protein ACXVLQ_08000 [Bacteriovorax sp.]
MKNWLYIPFLVLIAVTYTRVVANINSDESFNAFVRKPASIEEKIEEDECLDLSARLNPHAIKRQCEL